VFNTLVEAQQHLTDLMAAIPVGSSVVISGTSMTRQPYRETKPELVVGFGPGRYNARITAAELLNGTFTVGVPEKP